MNRILAAALFSTVFSVSAHAEDAPSAMADIMHSSPAMAAPEQMQGSSPADRNEDSESAGHGMDNHPMMGMKGDDCDTLHSKGDHHMMGMKGDDCDSKHMRESHHGYGMEGHGYGMMGGPGFEMMIRPDMHLLEGLDLSSEQRAKITRISDRLMHDNWTTQGLLNDETAKLRDLYEADKRDPAAIDKEYQRVFDLKRKMIETYLEAQNRIEDVLTPDQLQMMKEARRTMHRMD